MLNNSSTANQRVKLSFIEVMQLPVKARKAYIEKATPGMLSAQKRSALN